MFHSRAFKVYKRNNPLNAVSFMIEYMREAMLPTFLKLRCHIAQRHGSNAEVAS